MPVKQQGVILSYHYFIGIEITQAFITALFNDKGWLNIMLKRFFSFISPQLRTIPLPIFGFCIFEGLIKD